MKYIIFSLIISGHRLEYIHHFYELCKDKPQNDYIFVIPYSFNDIKKMYSWDIADNISFDFLTEEDISGYFKSMNKRKYICHLLNFKAISNSVFNVFTIDLEWFDYPSSRYLNRNIRLSGIMYDIFFYKIRTQSSLIEKLRYLRAQISFAHGAIYKNILLLNDRVAPRWMNLLFLTKRYKYIPDPYIPLPSPNIDFRDLYQIPKDKIIISHFGGLSKRKGTLLILDAINLMSKTELEKFVFVFAGCIYNDIKDDFYQKYNKIKRKSTVIIEDSFCSYEFFAALSKDSDLILLPYILTTRSSGIIGYGAQFNTPVCVPSKGFIANIVKTFKLGFLLDNCTSFGISEYLINCNYLNRHIVNSYCTEHSLFYFKKNLDFYL